MKVRAGREEKQGGMSQRVRELKVVRVVFVGFVRGAVVCDV